MYACQDRRRARLAATHADFEREIEHGSLYVGSPETVARKIAATVKALRVSRFDIKIQRGPAVA